MKTHRVFAFHLPVRLWLTFIGAALALLSCTAGVARRADKAEHEPIEAITIEGTMPNRAGEFSLRFTAAYERSEGSTVALLPAVGLNAISNWLLI
jgi:hypothetical protein